MNPAEELAKHYDPPGIEASTSALWIDADAFAAIPDQRQRRYVVMMPLPNVTGALHMGHAMDNVMQDLLVRWHRMQGDNTLWMAGTDHAGIGTQALIEKRVKELEGKTRHELGREELVRRIWAWKDQYQERIVRQQQAMGCSCDWQRQRFTMDAVCARAVRQAFFKMFEDGLIYQGARIVNWDCALQTAVADDELYKETVQGHFYYLRYPVVDPEPGEPTHVVVATTRPETMLGDTAVACSADPHAAFAAAIAEAGARLAAAAPKDRADLEAEVRRLEARREETLDVLMQIARMARLGRKVRLPLMGREIPILIDEWAKPTLGSGCVKITPAHDPNDHAVWTRHKEEIGIVNVLNPDGTLNANAGPFQGLDRFAARSKVMEALQREGLVEKVEHREIEIDHSDRSKTIIEPYLSKQWFVNMADVPGGVVMGRGTAKEHEVRGLAQAAMDAVAKGWRSPSGRNVQFHPDQDRYAKIYLSWLAEKRDWCISRQLWWGHRIPVWSGKLARQTLLAMEGLLLENARRDDMAAWVVLPDGQRLAPDTALLALREIGMAAEMPDVEVQVCLRDAELDERLGSMLRMAGLQPDPDVLDTWFSSALWPHSTLGWPDPDTAAVDAQQRPLGKAAGRPDCLSYYYPGSCLVTGRDIITLWVARMVVMGLYDLGDVPFTDVFIHANILDGKGERMSKSKGNGIDPLDIIEKYGADALRYVLCEMQTGTQDIRLPVQTLSPYSGEVIDLATAQHGRTIFTYLCPSTGKEFDVLGTMPELPGAKVFSDRFDVGRAFCNKLWNAARFALMNLEGAPFEPRAPAELAIEDRWILSRLARATAVVHAALEDYNPAAALSAARELFWSELCDWYLELVKERLRDPARAPAAKQVLAVAMDQVLRLLHPFVPFITEALWQKLNGCAPRRGIDAELACDRLLVCAAWPRPPAAWRDEELEARFLLQQEVVQSVREVRARYGVPPARKIEVLVRASGAAAQALMPCAPLIARMSQAASVRVAADVAKAPDAATAVVRDVELWVLGVIDVAKEKDKLGKQRDQLAARIAASEQKLGSAAFVAKAPAEVVDRERRQLADLQGQLQSVTSRLCELG